MNTRGYLVEGEIKQFFCSSWIEPKLSANGFLKSKFLIGEFKPSLLEMKLKNKVTTVVPFLKVYCDLYDYQKAPSREDFFKPARSIPYSKKLSGCGSNDYQNAPSFEEHCRRARSKPYSEKLSDDIVTARRAYVSPYGNGLFTSGYKKWQKGKVIGIGSNGIVHEAYDENGLFFAVKEVSLHDQGRDGTQRIIQLRQEISIMSRLSHENIVRYLGTDMDDDQLYIFLELATKGSLAELYENYYLRDSEVSAYTIQILNGLHYLHQKNVIHRDIKCANILVAVNGRVKLADFGMAKANTINDLKSCKGTAYWMAPEVANAPTSEGYGPAADIWSLGCTVLEMLTRKIPYSHLDWMPALIKISRGEPPDVPKTLSAEAQDFIHKCLQVNPNARPTAAKLLTHPFLRRPTSMNSTLASPPSNGTHF